MSVGVGVPWVGGSRWSGSLYARPERGGGRVPWGASAGPGHRGLYDRAGGRRDPRGPSAM